MAFGYTLRGKFGRVLYYGMTKDPKRRAAEHKKNGKRGKMTVETGQMSHKKAQCWEAGRLASYRQFYGGKNPFYNKTRSGGWKS